MTPEPVREYIRYLEDSLGKLQERFNQVEKRVEKLEVRNGKNSTNSSKPPASDSPYSKPKRKKTTKSKRKKGGQKGHPGHTQQLLEPTLVEPVLPERCQCGCSTFETDQMSPFYTHQHIELPQIQMNVEHYVLHKCTCPECGKTAKATLPHAVSSGYGPRMCAFIAELSGIKAMSRTDVKGFCESVLGIPIATGTIQKIIDRTSEAIAPAYQRFGEIARSAHCNYIDETSWFNENNLNWLWTMVNDQVAYYRIDPNRSKRAFKELIEDWRGVLISDSYGLYRNWVDDRQTCLAHLIRKAVGLSERRKRSIKLFGQVMMGLLRKLVSFAHERPSPKNWNEFYEHLLFTLKLFEEEKDDAGKLARQILRELDALWTFLDQSGVEPTNNRAERALRFGVLWRKRSLGTQSEKGNRWVERILSLKETCRLRSRSTFHVLADMLTAWFNNCPPDLAWI
jgi:transposase